jgi:hypothetical protein
MSEQEQTDSPDVFEETKSREQQWKLAGKKVEEKSSDNDE